jgi:hypothetical protein
MSHAAVVVAMEFAKFIATFESLLGRYDPTVADQIRMDPQVADRMLQAMEGEQNLMIFWKLNHGGLFSLIGQSRKALRYTIGNPRGNSGNYGFSMADSRHGQLRAQSCDDQ